MAKMTYEEAILRKACGNQFADWLIATCPDWYENGQRTMLMCKAWQAGKESQ